MLYLKLVLNEFKNENRDKRELSVAEALGYMVQVVAITKEPHDFEEVCDGYSVYRVSTRRLGQATCLHIPNRFIAFFGMIMKAIQFDADIISGHDWIALLAGYLANIVKRHPAKLIYDSHEFELYRYAPGRTGIQRKLIKFVEGFLIRRVDLALMVGDKIADGVQEIYHLETRPTVVRNIPPYWHLKPEKSAIIRRRFLEAMKLSPQGFLLMYHGGISRGRGIEFVIRALPFLPDDIGLVVMGYENEPGMIETMRVLAEEKCVTERVLFHQAVPVMELKDYIGAVDVELVLQSAWCINILYSLPNKFFESIQACVPLICCDLPEMGKIVRQYDIGLLVNEDDEKSVAEAVMKLRNDKSLYDRLKKNMGKAKEELCWEKESLKLKWAMQEVAGEMEESCKA